MQSVCAKMQACTLRAGRPASAPVAGRAAPLAARTAVRGAALEAKQASVSCSAQRSEALVTVCGSMQAGIGLLGNKAGMTSVFTKEGLQVPVTVIALMEGNVVTQVKTAETDGYNAVQVGYQKVNDNKLNKPEMGHIQKAGVAPMKHLKEFRLASVENFKVGQQLVAEEVFKAGDLVDVQGTSIGKGFQGGIKRYNFARGPMTHGSKSHRQIGSIGSNTTPGRVYPLKRMPGQMGNETVTVRKLEVVRVSNDVLLVKGAVPGKPGNVLRVTPAKIVGKNIPKQ